MSLRRLHRWLGLGLGAWFALVGLTGALLVFLPEIQSRHVAAAGPGPPRPFSALLAAAVEAAPDLPGGPLRIWPPAAPGDSFRADYRAPQGWRMSLYFDPATAAQLGEVQYGLDLIDLVHSLHRSLLLDRPGEVLVGLLALPLLGLLGAGLALWRREKRPSGTTPREPRPAAPLDETPASRPLRVPLASRPLREPLAGRPLRGRRLTARRHRRIGLVAALPLAVAAVSGIGMAFPDTTQWALYRVFRSPMPVASAPGAGPVGLDAAVALAQAQRPGWRVNWVDLPRPGAPPVLGVTLVPPSGWPGQAVSVAVEAATGALPEISEYHPAQRGRDWIVALHTGTMLGLPHRLLVLVAGLAPAGLFGLGLALWRRGRAARRLARADVAA